MAEAGSTLLFFLETHELAGKVFPTMNLSRCIFPTRKWWGCFECHHLQVSWVFFAVQNIFSDVTMRGTPMGLKGLHRKNMCFFVDIPDLVF